MAGGDALDETYHALWPALHGDVLDVTSCEKLVALCEEASRA